MIEIVNFIEKAVEEGTQFFKLSVFKEGMRNILKEALKTRDLSEDAAVLAKAATIC